MKKFLKIIFCIILIAAAGLIGWLSLTEFRPAAQEELPLLPDDAKDGTVTFVLTEDGARKYEIIRNSYTFLNEPLPKASAGQPVTVSSIDFEKFIAKSLFAETPDWEIERKESYQYFTRLRLEEIFRTLGFMIMREELQIEQWELWQKLVKILDGSFPFENITLYCIKL